MTNLLGGDVSERRRRDRVRHHYRRCYILLPPQSTPPGDEDVSSPSRTPNTGLDADLRAVRRPSDWFERGILMVVNRGTLFTYVQLRIHSQRRTDRPHPHRFWQMILFITVSRSGAVRRNRAEIR